MRTTRPWTQSYVYDARLPFAFTRTTYFDTEDLRFLDPCALHRGRGSRVRLPAPALIEAQRWFGEGRV